MPLYAWACFVTLHGGWFSRLKGPTKKMQGMQYRGPTCLWNTSLVGLRFRLYRVCKVRLTA